MASTQELYEDMPASPVTPKTSGTRDKFTTRVEQAKEPVGRTHRARDARKYPMSVEVGLKEDVSWGAGSDGCMTAAEFRNKMGAILEAFGLLREDDGIKLAMMNAVLYSFAKNGSSVARTGRGKLYVDGSEYDIQIVFNVLQDDVRRFCRAAANEMRDLVQAVIDGFDPSDPKSCEEFDTVMRLAADKGLTRFPALIADVSEYCSDLTIAQSAAVYQAKQYVLNGTLNSVDRVIVRRPEPDAGRYNSTTHQSELS